MTQHKKPDSGGDGFLTSRPVEEKPVRLRRAGWGIDGGGVSAVKDRPSPESKKREEVSRMEKTCSRCGSQLPLGAAFCDKCGWPVELRGWVSAFWRCYVRREKPLVVASCDHAAAKARGDRFCDNCRAVLQE